MFALALVLLACDLAESVELTRNVELNLRVIEGFARGPVIFELSITNRGTKPLFVDELADSQYCLLGLPRSWKLEPRRPRLNCPIADFPLPLDPGRTLTQHRVLQENYDSAFPAGTYEIGVLWRMRNTGNQKWEYSRTRRGPGPIAACITKDFSVTISPATPANCYALAARLTAEFAALPPPSLEDRASDGPFRSLCEKVTYSPHKELIPLFLHLVERASLQATEDVSMEFLCWRLVDTIFNADPTTAHRILVERLIESPPRVAPGAVINYWLKPHRELLSIQRGLFLIAEPRFWNEPKLWRFWNPLESLLALVRWANESAPQMLPDAELKRLAEAKDPQIRELVRKTFAHRLAP